MPKLKLQAEGWTVLTGGTDSTGYWCQIRRRDGRISHHEAESVEDAIADAWKLASKLPQGFLGS